MRRVRSAVSVLALLALSIPLIAGASPATEPSSGVGTAEASLLGAHLQVGDEDGLLGGTLEGLLGELALLEGLDTSALGELDTALDVGLLEGSAYATTREEPDAAAGLSPLRIGSERPFDVSAGPGERQGGDAISHVPGGLLSNVSLTPYEVSADIGDDHAHAAIDAVQATVGALDVTGLDLGLTGVVSEVTSTRASASQDLSVDGLAIGLVDILPIELLEALPLDSLLDVIDVLAVEGLLDAEGLQAQVHDLVASITGHLDDLAGLDLDALGDLDEGLLDELEDLLDLLGELDQLGLLAVLSDADLLAASGDSGLRAQFLGDVVDGIGGIIDDPGLPDGVTDLSDLLTMPLDELEDLLAGLGDDGSQLLDLLTGDLALLEDVLGLLDGVEAVLGTTVGCADDLPTTLDDLLGSDPSLESLLEVVGDVEDCVAEVLDILEGSLHELLGGLLGELGLGDVLDQLLALIADLGALDDLLAQLPGLLDDIADLDLLSADQLGLEVAAAAEADGGETVVDCQLGGLQILEQVVGDTACVDGSLDGDVDGAVDHALGVLAGVLDALPGVSGVSGLRLDLLPVADEEVATAEDDTVTARAHAVLLRLTIPSVEIDPDPSALLDDLESLDLGVVDELVDALDGILADAGLGDTLPTEVLAELTDALEAQVLDELGMPLDTVLGEVTGLLDDILALPLLDALGITVSTPSIQLELDTVSEATFTAASEDEPTAPAGPADPADPDDDPADGPSDPGDDPADPSDDPAPAGGAPSPVSDRPELPRTGGGLALLGLLAMMGAVGIRRMTG